MEAPQVDFSSLSSIASELRSSGISTSTPGMTGEKRKSELIRRLFVHSTSSKDQYEHEMEMKRMKEARRKEQTNRQNAERRKQRIRRHSIDDLASSSRMKSSTPIIALEEDAKKRRNSVQSQPISTFEEDITLSSTRKSSLLPPPEPVQPSAFKIKSALRPFVCVVCNKAFRQEAHLKVHSNSHSKTERESALARQKPKVRFTQPNPDSTPFAALNSEADTSTKGSPPSDIPDKSSKPSKYATLKVSQEGTNMRYDGRESKTSMLLEQQLAGDFANLHGERLKHGNKIASEASHTTPKEEHVASNESDSGVSGLYDSSDDEDDETKANILEEEFNSLRSSKLALERDLKRMTAMKEKALQDRLFLQRDTDLQEIHWKLSRVKSEIDKVHNMNSETITADAPWAIELVTSVFPSHSISKEEYLELLANHTRNINRELKETVQLIKSSVDKHPEYGIEAQGQRRTGVRYYDTEMDHICQRLRRMGRTPPSTINVHVPSKPGIQKQIRGIQNQTRTLDSKVPTKSDPSGIQKQTRTLDSKVPTRPDPIKHRNLDQNQSRLRFHEITSDSPIAVLQHEPKSSVMEKYTPEEEKQRGQGKATTSIPKPPLKPNLPPGPPPSMTTQEQLQVAKRIPPPPLKEEKAEMTLNTYSRKRRGSDPGVSSPKLALPQRQGSHPVLNTSPPVPSPEDILGRQAMDAYYVHHNIEKSESLFLEALGRNPEHPTNLGNYAAMLHTSRKDDKRAMQLFKDALRFNPKHSLNLSRFAAFLATQEGQTERAEQYHERAVDAAPGNASVLGAYAEFLIATNKDKSFAKLLLQKALDANPNHAHHLASLAKLESGAFRNHIVANKLWERAIAQLPNHPVLRSQYAEFLAATCKEVCTDLMGANQILLKAKEQFSIAIKCDNQNETARKSYARFLRDNPILRDVRHQVAIPTSPTKRIRKRRMSNNFGRQVNGPGGFTQSGERTNHYGNVGENDITQTMNKFSISSATPVPSFPSKQSRQRASSNCSNGIQENGFKIQQSNQVD